jgi:hypothetical protein
MTRRDRYLLTLVLARWGFAALVAGSVLTGFLVAVTVTPPTEVPTFALKAAVVYRVEVGTAVFMGLYLATMAFTLALHNRAFTEIGSAGFRARDLKTTSEAAISAVEAGELLDEVVEEVDELRTWRRESESVH